MPKTRAATSRGGGGGRGGEGMESYSNAFVFAKFVIHFARKFVEADGEGWRGRGRGPSFVAPPAIVKLDKVWIRIFSFFVVVAKGLILLEIELYTCNYSPVIFFSFVLYI